MKKYFLYLTLYAVCLLPAKNLWAQYIPEVTAAEYFWGTSDPGAGNGTVINAQDGNFNDVVEAVFKNNVTVPALGFNLLNVRMKGNNGTWGPLFKTVLNVDTFKREAINVLSAEYFWNTDPGEGMGTPLFAADGNFDAAIESITGVSASTALVSGPNRLSVRARGRNGSWGPVFSVIVIVDACMPIPLASVTAMGSTAICPGDSVLLNANTGSGLSYQWRRNGTNISGATNNQYVAKQNGLYSVAVTNTAGCIAISDTVSVTYAAASSSSVSITHNPATPVCPGTSITYSAVAINGGGSPTYQWQVNGLNVGNNSSTFSSSGLSQGDLVRCILTSSEACTLPDTSNIISVAIHSLPLATVSSSGSTTFCSGESVTLSAPASYTYTWSNGSVSQSITVSQSGNYSVQVTDGNNCTAQSDPVVVSVNQPSVSNVSASICVGNSYNFNGILLTQAGTYKDTIPNSVGCDSLITLVLSVGNSVSSTVSVSACGSYTWTSGNGQTYTSSTTATHTILGGAVGGCDSVVTLNLSIGNSVSSTVSVSACDSYTWTSGNGQTYTGSTTATHTIPGGAVGGCDSVVTLNLTINALDNGVSVNGVTLTAIQTGAIYQWIDCSNNNTPVSGATTQSFTPAQNGNYAVIVSANGCSETSSCWNITTISVNEYGIGTEITLFPNPSVNKATLGNLPQQSVISIMDISGKKILVIKSFENTVDIETSRLAPGVYTVHIESQGQTISKRLVVNK